MDANKYPLTLIALYHHYQNDLTKTPLSYTTYDGVTPSQLTTNVNPSTTKMSDQSVYISEQKRFRNKYIALHTIAKTATITSTNTM